MYVLAGNCAWRQAGQCKWDGPREPFFDKTCCSLIDQGASGYCECANGTITNKKGCSEGPYKTCNEACGSDKTCPPST